MLTEQFEPSLSLLLWLEAEIQSGALQGRRSKLCVWTKVSATKTLGVANGFHWLIFPRGPFEPSRDLLLWVEAESHFGALQERCTKT